MRGAATKLKLAICAVVMWCVSNATQAVGGGGGPNSECDANADPALTAARAAIERNDWAGAQSGLKQALAANPSRADHHNLYA